MVLTESEVEKLERHILEIAPTTRLELLTKIYFICQSRIVAAEDRKAMQLACKIILKYVDSLLSTRPQVSDNATSNSQYDRYVGGIDSKRRGWVAAEATRVSR